MRKKKIVLNNQCSEKKNKIPPTSADNVKTLKIMPALKCHVRRLIHREEEKKKTRKKNPTILHLSIYLLHRIAHCNSIDYTIQLNTFAY